MLCRVVFFFQVEQSPDTNMEQLYSKWIQLQLHVNCLIDSDLDKLTLVANRIPGIRQVNTFDFCYLNICTLFYSM